MPHRESSDATPESADASEADRIAQAVLAVSGVHELHAGSFGEVATYLPGRRVNGIRVRGASCAVHIVLEWDAPITPTTDLVRASVRQFVTGPIDVTVEDIRMPPELER